MDLSPLEKAAIFLVVAGGSAIVVLIAYNIWRL